jgi:hypothetical protein
VAKILQVCEGVLSPQRELIDTFTVQNAYRANKRRLEVPSRQNHTPHLKLRRKKLKVTSSSLLSFSLPSWLSLPWWSSFVGGLKTQ